MNALCVIAARRMTNLCLQYVFKMSAEQEAVQRLENKMSTVISEHGIHNFFYPSIEIIRVIEYSNIIQFTISDMSESASRKLL